MSNNIVKYLTQKNSKGITEARTGLLVQLRYDDYLSPNLVTGVEQTSANGYPRNNYGNYEFQDCPQREDFKMYISTDGGISFTEDMTFGGENGTGLNWTSSGTPSLIKQTLITNINQAGLLPPTYDVIYDEIGLLDPQYNGTGDYVINFDISETTNLTPLLNLGNSNLNRDVRAFWDGTQAGISLSATVDEAFNNASLLVTWNSDSGMSFDV